MPITISGSTGIAGVDGSASTPAVQGTDTNTGIAFPAADTVAIGTGGTERMRVGSSGNVGIGTTSPDRPLKIGGASASLGIDAGSGAIVIDPVSGGVAQIDVSGANALRFNTNSAERARIDSSGNMAIGTTSVGATRLRLKGVTSDATTFALYAENSSGTYTLQVRNDGAIGTGIAALSPYNLTTGNTANVFVDANGFLYRSTSSLKYKTDVKDATHGLAELMALRPVTYKGKNDGDKVFGGLIAEEVHDAGLTEFVQYAEDGSPDALAYGNMVSLLIKAIQELKAENDDLKARLTALEAK